MLTLRHTLLPSHSFNFGLTDSPLYYTFHLNLYVCDLPHFLYNCPGLQTKRKTQFKTFKCFNIPFNLHSILNTKSVPDIKLVIIFI